MLGLQLYSMEVKQQSAKILQKLIAARIPFYKISPIWPQFTSVPVYAAEFWNIHCVKGRGVDTRAVKPSCQVCSFWEHSPVGMVVTRTGRPKHNMGLLHHSPVKRNLHLQLYKTELKTFVLKIHHINAHSSITINYNQSITLNGNQPITKCPFFNISKLPSSDHF